MMTFIFLIGFFLVSYVHLRSIDEYDENLRNFTKPLLMSLLALFYIFAVPDSGITNIIIFVGLLACCVGDTFLMLDAVLEKGFLHGMMGFAIGHLLYILAVLIALPLNLIIGKFVLFLPVIWILYKSYPKYRESLGDMKGYVHLYILISLVLNFLVICGVSFSNPASWLLYAGSLLFIFSDSLLAMIDFGKEKIQNGRLYIMSTYISAQFLIASGMLFY